MQLCFTILNELFDETSVQFRLLSSHTPNQAIVVYWFFSEISHLPPHPRWTKIQFITYLHPPRWPIIQHLKTLTDGATILVNSVVQSPQLIKYFRLLAAHAIELLSWLSCWSRITTTKAFIQERGRYFLFHSEGGTAIMGSEEGQELAIDVTTSLPPSWPETDNTFLYIDNNVDSI